MHSTSNVGRKNRGRGEGVEIGLFKVSRELRGQLSWKLVSGSDCTSWREVNDTILEENFRYRRDWRPCLPPSPRSILRSSLKSSRWPRAKFISNDLVKMATGSLLVIATLSDPFCGYRPFLSERNFLLLTRMYSERGCFICSISSFIERIYNWYYFFSSFYSLFEMIKFSNWNNNNNSNNRKGERISLRKGDVANKCFFISISLRNVNNARRRIQRKRLGGESVRK